MNKQLIRFKETIKTFWIKFKIKIGKDEKEEEIDLKQDEYTEEEFKELDSAGYSLSRQFRLSLLRKSSMLGRADVGKEGQEVHGWMQIIFGNRYKWLIQNDVFDRALNYASQYYNPEVFNVVKNFNFEDATVNLMILSKKTWFDKFPEFEFDKAILLTEKDKTFEESVLWEDQVRDDDGYRVVKSIADCNFLNLGFTLWDKPVLVLKDAVGMDKMFFQAKTTADQIVNIKDQLLKMHIYTKRVEEDTMKEKLLEKDIKYNKLKEKYEFMNAEFLMSDPRDPEEIKADTLRKYDKSLKKGKSGWKRIVLITAAVIVVVAIMFVIAALT